MNEFHNRERHQKRFAGQVRAYVKRSTIRTRRKNGYIPKVGEKIALYTGQRTKACRLLRRVVVKSVRPIVINTDDSNLMFIILDGHPQSQLAITAIVKQDGFTSREEFAAFFNEQYGPSVNAYLIEW